MTLPINHRFLNYLITLKSSETCRRGINVNIFQKSLLICSHCTIVHPTQLKTPKKLFLTQKCPPPPFPSPPPPPDIASCCGRCGRVNLFISTSLYYNVYPTFILSHILYNTREHVSLNICSQSFRFVIVPNPLVVARKIWV